MVTQSESASSLPLHIYLMIVLEQGSKIGCTCHFRYLSSPLPPVETKIHKNNGGHLTPTSHARLGVLYLREKVPSVTNG